MRPRAQNYSTLNGLSAERDAVPWHWRMLGILATFLILGGFLMLPTTFYTNTRELRVSQAAIGIFAVALLIIGFALTALLSFTVRNLFFQADAIFLPSLIASIVGLLTVFYDFIVFNPYAWNIPALLTIIAAAISTIIYAIFLILTLRKVTLLRASQATAPNILTIPTISPAPVSTEYRSAEPVLWQDPAYYENYVRNMFPTSTHPSVQPQYPTPWDSAGANPGGAGTAGHSHQQVNITEEEMQRQQMLQLLLQRQPIQGLSTPSTTANTFHIDWQGREDEEEQQHHENLYHLPPAHGYYAPTAAQLQAPHQTHQSRPSQQSLSSYSAAVGSQQQQQQQQQQQLVRQLTQDLQPWDGVWRAPPRNSTQQAGSPQPVSRELREARRREIESGSR